MKYLFLVLALALLSCQKEQETSSINPENWKKRAIKSKLPESLVEGKTYLSVYSQIYSRTQKRTQDLTATVSIRNISESDTMYILRAEYFDTHGKSIRKYFKDPIFVAPLETVEIVVDEVDKSGGTGGNFIFDWKAKPQASMPFFECVMISTLGQQGLSFTTRGQKID